MSNVTVSHVNPVGPAATPVKSVEAPAIADAKMEAIKTYVGGNPENIKEEVAQTASPDVKEAAAEVKVEAEEQDPVTSRRLAELARRQRRDRQEAEKIKAEREAFEQKAAKVNPLLEIAERLDQDPNDADAAYQLLEAVGQLRGKQAAELLEELTDRILATPQEEQEEPELTVEQIVEQKLLEIDQKRAEEAQVQFIEEQFAAAKKSIEQIAKDKSDVYELVVDEPDFVEQAFEIRMQHFYDTQELLPIETILNHMEEELEKRALDALKYKKVQQKVSQPTVETSYETTKVSGHRDNNRAPTLTNRLASEVHSNATVEKGLSKQELLRRMIDKLNNGG